MRSNSRLWLLVIALLATAMIAVGCGDDDDGGDSGGGTTAAQTETSGGDTGGAETTEESGGGEATEDTGGADAPDASDPAVQQAIDACKQQVDANPTISEDVKQDINAICDEIATGDADAIRQKTKEVCTKIVEETAPEGPARDQALMACDAATATP